MIVNERMERDLPGILAEIGGGPNPDYADSVIARTAGIRQRPTWRFPERWLPASVAESRVLVSLVPTRRMIGVLTIILLTIALVATAIYVGSRNRLPPPFGPARNGSITYAVAGDIFVGDPASGTSVAIVGSADTYDFGSFFSPDGTKVAFLRRVDPNTDGKTDIVVARPDGSAAIVITMTPLDEPPWVAQWTPDGASIAVITSERLDARLELYDARKAAAPRSVDPGEGMTVGSLAFQPPYGQRVLFRGQIGFKIGLYAMNLDGSGRRTLVESFSTEHPKDNNLPLSNWQDPNGTLSDIWSYDPAALAELRDSAWSPDGRRVVFDRYMPDNTLRLFILDVDGGDPQPIGFTPGDTRDVHPVWSPDGTRVAFLRYRAAEDAWSYAVVRLADGSVISTGPAVPGGVAGLSWSPDGKALLAIEHTADQRLIVLDPAGGPEQYPSWKVEVPGWWEHFSVMNATDFGSWQRLAGP